MFSLEMQPKFLIAFILCPFFLDFMKQKDILQIEMSLRKFQKIGMINPVKI